MELKGKVHEVGTTQQVSETFKKRTLVVEYAENPTYPEYISLDAIQDKADLLNNIKVGDEVEVFFNLRGRPWTDKEGKTVYFNSLIIWRINSLTSASQPQASVKAQIEDDFDDLPF